MQISHNPDNNRIVPAEMRYLRTESQKLHREGTDFWCTVRTIVISAAVCLGWDLSQEEKALRAEQNAGAEPQMQVVR